MAPDLVADRVVKVLAPYVRLHPQKITAGTPFGTVAGVDSLDGVEVVMELEEEFGIEIPDAVHAEKWPTVGDAIAYIEGRLS